MLTIARCNAFSFTLSNGQRVLHDRFIRSDGLRIIFPDNFVGYTVHPIVNGWIVSV